MEYVCGLFCVYVTITIISVFVMRARAGAGVWHRLKVIGDNGFGVGWVMTISIAATFWPITLGRWLLRGCPEPRVVFNEKAVERRRRMGEGY